jgi:hypothetical protein
MRSTNTVYVTTQAEYDKHKSRLNQMPCPKCRVVGCLIRHGYLRGYGEGVNETVQRGWRVFCSNRGRKTGCGKTYAILLAQHLYRRLVGASRLWNFLAGLLDGACIKEAWEAVASPFRLETGYKLWSCFGRSQSAIRVSLHSMSEPQKSALSPLMQTIAHLRAGFPRATCPIAAYQHSFQRGFLVR